MTLMFYYRELAPGSVSLTGDSDQGDDSKQCAYSRPYKPSVLLWT